MRARPVGSGTNLAAGRDVIIELLLQFVEVAVPHLIRVVRDHVKIQEIAVQHSTPIIEDKHLARSKDDGVEVDRAIPPEFYKAVAELIHILYAKSPRMASAK